MLSTATPMDRHVKSPNCPTTHFRGEVNNVAHCYTDGQVGQVKSPNCPATQFRGEVSNAVHCYDDGQVGQVKPTDWTAFKRMATAVEWER